MNKKIIAIGLGNPGQEFDNTRHNVGFMALDAFAKKNGCEDFTLQKKSNALVSENTIKGKKIILAKPQTFMNNSGRSAKEIIRGSLSAEKIIIHDDADIPLGSMKIVRERGSAGHKGVESIIRAISNKDLIRIRVGIGAKRNIDAMKIVLKKFSPDEQATVKKIIARVADALDVIIQEGLDKAMNEYNQ